MTTGGRFTARPRSSSVNGEVLAVPPRPSLTVTITEFDADAPRPTVPLMIPVVVLMVRPLGSPVAL